MRRTLTAIFAAVILLTFAVAVVLMVFPGRDQRFLNLGSSSSITPRPVRTIRGPDGDRLMRPVAVTFAESRLYVADSGRGVVDVFSPGGHHYATWGRGLLRAPAAISRNPKSGDLYVVDRELDGIVVFGKDGTEKGRFAPLLPGAASWSQTPTALWSPVGIDFTPSGYAYVTDVRSAHRLLIFNPDGVFEGEASGTAGIRNLNSRLSYPTAVKVRGNEVWVADSNNMRVVVYDLSGRLLRSFGTGKLPRGIAFASGPGGDSTAALIIDPMSSNVSAWEPDSGDRVLAFGGPGPGQSQFSFPNGIAADDDGLVFVADTGNARVSVWSWTGRIGNRGLEGWRWWLLLVPLLPLVGVPFALRRPRYFLTADFVTALHELGRVQDLADIPGRLECLLVDWNELKALESAGGPLVPALQPVRGSESDQRAYVERYRMTEREAEILAAARGSAAVLTEDAGLLRAARLVGMRAENSSAFVEQLDDERTAVHRD